MAIKGNMERPCIIYLVISKVTGKTYVGVTTQARPVLCLEDGQSYSSIADAVRSYDVDSGTLTKVCQGKRRAVEGLTFKYMDVS